MGVNVTGLPEQFALLLIPLLPPQFPVKAAPSPVSASQIT